VKAEIEKHFGRENTELQSRRLRRFSVICWRKEKSVDAILCATPDHLHAYVSVTAMRLKKHVYCEKPLTHNVWEARQVARVAKETGVATTMGNQGHSGDFIRQTCEIMWDGAIGDVREVTPGPAPLAGTKVSSDARQRRGDSQRGELGSVAWSRASRGLQCRVESGSLARFLGLRHRAHWGFLLPQLRSGDVGAEFARTAEHRSFGNGAGGFLYCAPAGFTLTTSERANKQPQ